MDQLGEAIVFRRHSQGTTVGWDSVFVGCSSGRKAVLWTTSTKSSLHTQPLSASHPFTCAGVGEFHTQVEDAN